MSKNRNRTPVINIGPFFKFHETLRLFQEHFHTICNDMLILSAACAARNDSNHIAFGSGRNNDIMEGGKVEIQKQFEFGTSNRYKQKSSVKSNSDQVETMSDIAKIDENVCEVAETRVPFNAEHLKRTHEFACNAAMKMTEKGIKIPLFGDIVKFHSENTSSRDVFSKFH